MKNNFQMLFNREIKSSRELFNANKVYFFSFASNCSALIIIAHRIQGTKKLVSDSPGLVDFAVGLVDFTLNLPEMQVKALRENPFEEIWAS